jgi:hypothetical protein
MRHVDWEVHTLTKKGDSMITLKHSRGVIVFLAAFFVLLAGCAGKKSPQMEGQRLSELPASLTIVNRTGASMHIYLKPELSGEIYLGRVSFGETKVLRIQPPFPSERARLVATPIPATSVDQPIVAELGGQLEAGDTLHWDLLLKSLDWEARDANK